MSKKIMTASLIVFTLCVVMDYVLHGVVLRGLYASVPGLWRSAEDIARLTWIVWVVDAAIAYLFVWLYSKGLEAGKAWLGQGIRFGLVLGLLFSLPMGFSMYAIMPIPFSLAFGWFAGALAELLVMGIATAWVFRS